MEFTALQELPKSKYLWRYIDPYKFLSFLQSPSLRFTRLDVFDDIFEGYGSEIISLSKLLQVSDFKTKKKEIESLNRIIPNMIYTFYQIHKQEQEKYYASCFFTSDTESIQMWKTYGSQYGIALRIDSKSIIDLILRETELKNNFEIYFGHIKYFNFFSKSTPADKELINSEFNPFHKDSIYSSENEFRIILKNKNNSEISELPLLPLGEIIDQISVFTFPSINNWEYLTIKDTVVKYGYSAMEVSKSIIITKEILDKIEKEAIYNGLEKLAAQYSNFD